MADHGHHLADELRQCIRPHLHTKDPAGWIRVKLKEHQWSQRVAIVNALRDHPKVAVHSCHDAVESYIVARVAGWWIDVHPPGSAFVVSKAPTYKQVHAVLWEEIRTAHTKGALPGRVTQSEEWKITDRLVGYGRKPADHDERNGSLRGASVALNFTRSTASILSTLLHTSAIIRLTMLLAQRALYGGPQISRWRAVR